MSRFTCIAAFVYFLLLTALVVGMAVVRQRALQSLTSPQSQAAWEAWRTEAGEQATGKFPVRRQVPRSSEPPTLVLLRDHFAVCLAGAIAMTSALYGFFVLMLRGAFLGPSFEVADESEPGEQRG